MFFIIKKSRRSLINKDKTKNQIKEISPEQRIIYFKHHREEIIASIQLALKNKNYLAAAVQAEKYLIAQDKQINGLYFKANLELDSIKSRKQNDTSIN